MRIVIVQTYHYYRGGDCTYGFSLANLLQRKGHKINFFSMQHPENILSDDKEYFVDYIDFREVNKKPDIASASKVFIRSIYSSHVRKKFSMMLKDKKPNIIHIQNLHGHITPSILFEAKKHSIPVVMTLHDFKFICPNTHFLSHGKICEKCKGGKFYECVLNKCKKDSLSASIVASLEAYVHKLLGVRGLIDIYIAPSYFLKQKFIEFGWQNDKIDIICNFLKNENFENIFEPSEKYILYFGQIEPWKGLNTLISAAKQLKNIEFKIAGNGEMKEILMKRCEEEFVHNVKFIGFHSGDKLKNIIKNSRFVIMPSESYENFPYSIMEAFALRKPVIASAIGGIPELVINNKNGLLFEKGNVEDLARKIKTLYYNEDKYMEYCKFAYSFASLNYKEESHYEKINNLYETLLKERK